jgi:hypothetical protein
MEVSMTPTPTPKTTEIINGFKVTSPVACALCGFDILQGGRVLPPRQDGEFLRIVHSEAIAIHRLWMDTFRFIAVGRVLAAFLLLTHS